MNTRLKTLVTGLVVVVGVGTLMGTTATASATTLKPRTVLLRDINADRAAHGLRALRPSRLLRYAAKRHSNDMLIRDYFTHTAPGGGTLYDRIVRSGFVRGYSWEAGETLAWGTGSLATPARS